VTEKEFRLFRAGDLGRLKKLARFVGEHAEPAKAA
jgi:hypothetical protein